MPVNMVKPELITELNHDDLSLVARCHREAFPKALSSAMGQTYCKKMLEWYISGNQTFIFYLRLDDICVGYCGGLLFDGKHPLGSASSMIQYSFHEAVKAILLRPWLLFHPEFIRKYRLVLKNVWRHLRRYVGKPVVSHPPRNVRPHAGLIVIGVAPAHQGKGYGSMLLKEFENQAKKRGYKHLMLTVLRENKQAIEAYSRNGWIITRQEGYSLTMEKLLS